MLGPVSEQNEGQGFVDPAPALLEEYAAAVDRLRRKTGDPGTLSAKWRFWRVRRRLRRDILHRSRRSANW